MYGPEKCQLYLKLPYIGSASLWFKTALPRAVHNGYDNESYDDFYSEKCFPVWVKTFLVTSHLLWKILASPSSAILKHLLENDNCARRYNSDCFSVIEYAETPFKLWVMVALLVQRHKPTLNIQKKAYQTLVTPNQAVASSWSWHVASKSCENAGDFLIGLLVTFLSSF